MPDGEAQRLLVKLEEARAEQEAANRSGFHRARTPPRRRRQHGAMGRQLQIAVIAASLLAAVVLHFNRPTVFSPSAAWKRPRGCSPPSRMPATCRPATCWPRPRAGRLSAERRRAGIPPGPLAMGRGVSGRQGRGVRFARSGWQPGNSLCCPTNRSSPPTSPPWSRADDRRLLRRGLATRGDALRAGRGRRWPGLPGLLGPFPRALDVSCVLVPSPSGRGLG